MITVMDFVGMCTDSGFLKVEIYGYESEDVLWYGDADDIPEQYAEVNVETYDVPYKVDHITLNVNA